MKVYLIHCREYEQGCGCCVDFLDSIHSTEENAIIRQKQLGSNAILSCEYVHTSGIN